MTPVDQLVPFDPRLIDGLQDVVRASDAQRPAKAKQLYRSMADAKSFEYWKAADPEDAAVAATWHNLRNAVRAVANSRKGALDAVSLHFDTYRNLQRDLARQAALEVREYAQIDYDDHPTDQHFLDLEKAKDDLLVLSCERLPSSDSLLRGDKTASSMQSATHDWTAEFHELATDRAITARETLQERSVAAAGVEL